MSATIGDEIRKITERYETKLAEARDRLAAARNDALEEAAKHLEDMGKATPLGHENPQRGASTYNWLCAHAKAIRTLKTETKP